MNSHDSVKLSVVINIGFQLARSQNQLKDKLWALLSGVFLIGYLR